ncbi:MAG TPA: VOC family protein [Anaerolineae bacterium]|nr:VOC family protein [Anaerolineae bacterium]
MELKEDMMKSHICHIEIPVTDLKKAWDFYGSIFGWEIEIATGFPDYALWKAEKEPGGGFFKTDEIKQGHPMVHIHVDDIEDTLNKIVEKGGKVIHPKTGIGKEAEHGYFAIFEDIFGNHLGLYSRR